MEPTLIGCAAGDDWQVMYFVSNITDRKVWEGHGAGNGAVESLAIFLGYKTEQWEMTDEDEYDGCTPDTWASVKSKRKYA